MKKLLPVIITAVLLVVLLVATMLSDRLIGKSRLEEVANLPDYVPKNFNSIISTEPAEKGRDDAPNITLTDADGNKVTLEQFRGKPVVINFWASWSSLSYREFIMFQQAYEEYKDQVHFLMINTTSDNRETREAADKMIADGGYTFPVYYDLDASAATEFSVISLPTSFFIDANGKAVAYAAGEITRANLDLGLQLCQKSVEDAGGIQYTEPTTAVDTTDPTAETTEETVSEEDA